MVHDNSGESVPHPRQKPIIHFTNTDMVVPGYRQLVQDTAATIYFSYVS